ncbi:MAG: DinB family protein [bacterium]
MNSSMSVIAGLYKLGNSLFLDKIGHLDQELVVQKISGSTNPIIWLAGHITAVRYHLMNVLGTKSEFPWAKLFEDPYDASKDYPDMSEVKDAWVAVSDQLVDKICQASEETLQAELKYQLPHKDNTVRGAIVFFAYHESWHLGQISYIRKSLEMEGLVSF